jgi:hypothetical protein
MKADLCKWAVRLFIMSLLASSTALAEELKIEARLIWGTNDDKSPDPNHKLVDSRTAQELRKVFVWKNYFEVSRTNGTVPNRGTNSFTVSKHCTVEIAELEGPKVSVLLIGKGKPQNRTTKALSRAEPFVLAGDVKDGSAWFVIISQLDEKAAVANGKPAPPAAAPNSKKSEEPKVTNTASAKTTNTASK